MCAHYENLKEPRHLRESFGVEPPPTLGKVDVWPGYEGLFIRRSLVRVQVGEPSKSRVSRLAPADFFAFWDRRVRHVSEILCGSIHVSGSQHTPQSQGVAHAKLQRPANGRQDLP